MTHFLNLNFFLLLFIQIFILFSCNDKMVSVKKKYWYCPPTMTKHLFTKKLKLTNSKKLIKKNNAKMLKTKTNDMFFNPTSHKALSM